MIPFQEEDKCEILKKNPKTLITEKDCLLQNLDDSFNFSFTSCGIHVEFHVNERP